MNVDARMFGLPPVAKCTGGCFVVVSTLDLLKVWHTHIDKGDFAAISLGGYPNLLLLTVHQLPHHCC